MTSAYSFVKQIQQMSAGLGNIRSGLAWLESQR